MLLDTLLPAEREGPWKPSLSLLTASSPLQAAPCPPLRRWLVLRWSSWGSREPCTGTAGSGAEKGGEEEEKGVSVQEDFPAKSIPKEKSWKGREHKKARRISEAWWLSCLVRGKPARALCLTVRCESNPRAKPVRVALGPEKALFYFVYVVKPDFQSAWEGECSAAWLEEGRQERWCFGMPLLGHRLCSHSPGGALGSAGESLWRLTWFLRRDCSSPKALCFSDILGRLAWALALLKRPGAPLHFLTANPYPCCETEVSFYRSFSQAGSPRSS